MSPGGPRDRSDGAGASGPFSLSGLLAAAPDLAAALPGIERAAGSDAPLLLIGEPGTGRSTLARAIHGAGPRAGGPLVEADAASLPSTLFESELFGYRPGAFTGADRPRDGRVARAEGGTLVLDHLEELPRTIQPKLLRLIAERRYAPLGGSEREAEVRFLALAAGDLPGVVETLLADLRQRLGRPGVELAPAASEWIVEHPWPGNLTQLRSVLERALILHEDGPLEPEPPEEGGDRPRPLVEMEKAEIRRALAYTRGHQGRAAELLGISRKALWEKRKRHGIP